jgi:hypothetical protein
MYVPPVKTLINKSIDQNSHALPANGNIISLQLTQAVGLIVAENSSHGSVYGDSSDGLLLETAQRIYSSSVCCYTIIVRADT